MKNLVSDAQPIPAGAEAGYEQLQLVRHRTQLGSDFWTLDKLCQATAKTTGRQCRSLPIRGTRLCRKHGGKNTKVYQKRKARMKKPPNRPSERGRIGADYQLEQWHRQVEDQFGGAKDIMAALDDDQQARAYSVRQTMWMGARYKNRRGWRVGTWLAMRYVTGEITADQMRRWWCFIDPGIDAMCDRWELGSGMTTQERSEVLWLPPWTKRDWGI